MWSTQDPVTLFGAAMSGRGSVSVDGIQAKPYTLRVTQVYRRENGEWKVVHRHGDAPPTDQTLPGGASTT